MLKVLAMVVVLLSHVAIVSVLLPDHIASPVSNQAHSNTGQGNLPPAPPSESQVHTHVTNNPETQSTSQNDIWIRAGVVVNVFLVLVTIGIAATGYFQARAALLNAQNLANSERARMAYAGQPMGHSLEFSAKNVGRVVAGITYARGFTEALPYGQPLPETPKYLDGRKHVDADEWVSPGDFANIPREGGGPFLLVDLSDPNLREAIQDRNTSFWVYARICYQDGISPEIRETRFCFSISIKEDGYPEFMRAGPSSYNLYT